eukprot:8912587-Ditylum_brightwellii.AAC.1
MRDIATEKDLAKYLIETNSWTPELFSWIAWPTFQRCCNSLDKRDNQIVKLTHNLLPTNSQVHEYDKLVPDKFTFCKACSKTRDHLVQCTSAVVK